MDPSDETTRRHRDKARFEVRKQKRPDYYAILGVPRVASVPEIKAGYKRACMEYHPDRHAGKPEAERVAAEEKFKLLGGAGDHGGPDEAAVTTRGTTRAIAESARRRRGERRTEEAPRVRGGGGGAADEEGGGEGRKEGCR